MRAQVSIVALILMALVAGGCDGGGEADETTQTTTAGPGVATVTMTDDSCDYDGPDAVGDGKLVVEFVKDADGEGLLELLRLSDGTTFDDLDARVQGDSERLEQGLLPIGYEPLASLEAQLPLLGPERQRILSPLPQDLEPGDHALLCIASDWLELGGPLTLTE